MREDYKIEIESKGPYDTKKEFNMKCELTGRQYIALVAAVLDFMEKLTDETV